MLGLIGFIAIVWVLIYKRKVVVSIFSPSKNYEAETQYSSAILDFSLAAVLTKLSAEQRILFRDSINGYINTIYNPKDMRRVFDLSNILNLETLYTARKSNSNLTEDAETCVNLVLSVIDTQIKLAPSSYSRLITIQQLTNFLQQRI